MQAVGPRRGGTRGNPRGMGIMTIGTREPEAPALAEIPASARPPVRASGPVAIVWGGTTAAHRRAVRLFQFPSVANLDREQVRLVVTIIAEVVSIMRAMPHRDVRVLFWDDDPVLRIEANRR